MPEELLFPEHMMINELIRGYPVPAIKVAPAFGDWFKSRESLDDCTIDGSIPINDAIPTDVGGVIHWQRTLQILMANIMALR